MLSLGALLVTAWLGEPMSASADAALSVDVAPELHCPNGSAVMGALVKQLAPMRVVQAKEERQRFHLKLRPHGPRGVALTLYDQTARLVDRTIEIDGRECQGIAQTVALITATWTKSARGAGDVPSLEPAPTPAPRADARPPPPPPASEVLDQGKVVDEGKASDDGQAFPSPPSGGWPSQDREVAPTLPRPLVPPAPSVEAPGPVDVPPPPPAAREEAPPREDVEVPADDSAAEEAPAPAKAVEPAPSVPAVHHLRFEAGAGTTISLSDSPQPTVTGRLGLEGSRNLWLLGVRGHIESARTLEGSVDVRQAQIDLTLGANVVHTPRWHGAVLAGGGVDLLSARAPNHEHSGVMRSFSPLGLLALRAGFQPHPLFDLFTAIEFVLGFRRERFVSDGESLASTARCRTRLLLGVSWHVF